MKTILAPLDFSGVTDAVVGEAAALARAFGGKIALLAIIQPQSLTHEYAMVMENLAEITSAGERNAARRLGQIEEKLRGQGLAVESVQLVGAPITLIADHAKKIAADYIVMGSHGHTALYDLLVGSTTHGVLMRAQCPVVVIPSQAKPAPG